MRYLIICLLVCLSVSAYAATESDFAYGYTLEVDGDGAIYSLNFPEAVYKGLTRADRGDLRVFNSNGVSVPLHIQRRKLQEAKPAQSVALPIFPLYADTVQQVTGTGYSAHIVTDDKGAIIDINYGKLSSSTSRSVTAYLLDCSQLAQVPNALILTWPDSESNFVINAELAGSNDLTHWEPLIVRKTFSNLQYGEHILIQRRIDLPIHKFKYLKINWLGDKSLVLSQVSAQFPAVYELQDRSWSSFPITQFKRKDNAYLFDTHSVLPADRVNIDLPQANTLVTASVWSSVSKKGPWRLQFSGLLYDLQVRNDEVRTPAQSMQVNTDRYWKLQLTGPEQKLKGNPLLRLGWIPEQLYFVAQGEAPFMLAYGSARVKASNMPLGQLLDIDKLRDKQELIKPAQLGSQIELGNKDVLEPPGRPLDWKQILLWLVLILAVAVLAVMAMRLYKQLDQPGSNE